MIVTGRLKIAPFSESDAQSFFELTLDDGFRAFPITDYRQKDLASAREWIRQVRGKYGVWERQSGALIGMGGLSPWEWEGEPLVDLTYRLRRSAWGQGLGPEMAQALVTFGFNELQLRQITATITPDNLASQQIAQRLGMKFDRHILLLGVPTDLYRLRID